MTPQEAIRILHPDTTREALSGMDSKTMIQIVNEACLTACEALEKQFEIDADAPTVDAVQVIRCKYCKHADTAYCRDHKTISRTDIYCIKDENRHENAWFCADGERKVDKN